MSSLRLNEGRNGKEGGRGKEWSPADTHVCSVFHDSGVYPVKIHSSLRTIIKRLILIFFFHACAQKFRFWGGKTPTCDTGCVYAHVAVFRVCVCVLMSGKHLLFTNVLFLSMVGSFQGSHQTCEV